jgi:hypothetical protein
VRGIRFGISGRVALALAAVALVFGACSSKDIRNEPVATVNGDEIRVEELREFLGFRGGATPATGIPAEKKKEAMDRLVAGRLLAQDARAGGLDNTAAFREAVAQNEQGVWIAALFRKEVAAKLKITDDEVRAEAQKLRGADNALTEGDATQRAAQAVSEAKLRGIEQDLVAAAKKEFPGTIDRETLQKVGKGKIPDNAVLASVGSSRITYGETMRALQAMVPGGHGAAEIAQNPAMVERVLDREITGRSLEAYAKKQGLEGSETLKFVRRDMERSILINLAATRAVSGAGQVTDKEIADAYAEHQQTFVRDGKKIPLSQVKEQLRQFLQNGKQRKALEDHIAGLKKNAKISVHEDVLAKV